MAGILFEKLCNVFEELLKNKKEQYRILSDFINEIKIESKSTGNKEFNLYPVVRLLLPILERERCAYNLKEAKLGKLLIKVLALPKNSPGEQKLTNFAVQKNSKEGSDFASVAYFVLNSRVGQTKSTLTIGDINDSLDKIASAEVGSKGPILEEAFTYVVKNATARQAKWFLRIVLKDLKLGMGKAKILSAIHPDAPEYYETCSSLLKLCEEIDDGNARPLELGIELFTAVSPMLSERLDIKSIANLPKEKSYLVEIKFDGERFQMHMQDGEFEYYSRRGFTYSSKFGKTYDSEGLLAPLLKDSFKPGVNSFILDGEMMGWHKERECFGSKGMSYDIKKITESSKYRPCFCAFDVLYYNGKTLVGHPDKGGLTLSQRLCLLDGMFTDVQGVIQHSKRLLVNDRSEILNAFLKARENAEEGIVLKDCDSYYIANRRNAGWYKIKPEYTEGTMEDLDLVIIGANYSENKKRGLARSFVVACVDRTENGQTRWVSVGRAATGLSFDERELVCNALQPYWQCTAQVPPPDCLVFNKDRPDLWLRPENSIVLTVRATELIRSNIFGTNYTLQFPRIERIRDDKPVEDAMTFQEFNGLVANKGPVVKLSTKLMNLEDIETEAPKTRRKRPAKVLQVADQFRANTDGVEATSRALAGRKLCVLSDDEDCSKAQLEAMIVTHGGIVVQNITPSTWCCIVGRMNMRVRNNLDSPQADVVPSAWLRSLQASSGPCPPPVPLDFLATTTTTKMRLARHYDPYGDSYTEAVDEETLKRCFDKMERDKEPEIYLTAEEMSELDKELFGENPNSFLRPCFIHISDYKSIIALKAKMYGASLCSWESPNLTHVVVSKRDSKEHVLQMKKKVTVSLVSEDWLDKCLVEGELVPEISFKL